MLKNISFTKSFPVIVLSAISFSFILLSVSTLAQAYSYAGIKWGGTSVGVDVSDASWPSSWISSLASGMSAWNGASSPFTFNSSSSGHKFTRSNMGTGALAITTTTSSGSTVTDSDTNFNLYYSWSTSGDGCCYDVQNVATHELGHWLVLNDLYGGGDTEKTMYYSASAGETKKRTLDADDTNGINYIYP
jgi:hypothetical protein